MKADRNVQKLKVYEYFTSEKDLPYSLFHYRPIWKNSLKYLPLQWSDKTRYCGLISRLQKSSLRAEPTSLGKTIPCMTEANLAPRNSEVLFFYCSAGCTSRDVMQYCTFSKVFYVFLPAVLQGLLGYMDYRQKVRYKVIPFIW